VIRNYLIDIDGTITDDVPNEMSEKMIECLPYDGSVDQINKWYEDGNIITFFTSRTEDMRDITETWLNKHGYKYHAVLMNKPRMINGAKEYVWIDNHVTRAVRYKGVWSELKAYIKRVMIFEE